MDDAKLTTWVIIAAVVALILIAVLWCCV